MITEPDTLPPEQRAWADRVLAILGLPGARDGGAARQPLEDVDPVGEGYRNYVAEPSGALKAALDAPTITLDHWAEIAKPHGGGAAERGAVPKELTQEMTNWLAEERAAMRKQTALMLETDELVSRTKDLQAYRRTRDKLAASAEEGTECDLEEDPPFKRVVAKDEVTEAANKLQVDIEKMEQEILQKHNELTKRKQILKALDERKPPAAVGECLRLLDDPENNPERGAVTRLLSDIQAVETTIAQAGEPTNETAGKKLQALAALERQLNEWHDRRTRQGIAPSAEALALSDLVQKAHLGLVTQVLDHPDWDPPVMGFADLPEEARGQVKRRWAELRDQTGKVQIPGKDVTIKAGRPPKVLGGGTADEAARFRRESLANFARLLGSEAGRSLVNELAGSEEEIMILRSDKAESYSTDSEGGGGTRWPSGSVVGMPSGQAAADSSKPLFTKSGNFLYSPSFISLGHELIHALHNSKGKNRRQDKSEKDTDWDNLEEFLTIIGGDLSEQDLRQQYGLTAERYGHRTIEPDESVAQAYAQAIDDRRKLSDESTRKAIAEKLTELGLADVPLCDRKKVEYSEYKGASLDGLIQLGWDLNLLTPAQAEAVAKHGCRPEELKRLMWSPNELPDGTGPASIVGVLKQKRHHPRSPEGRRFRSLGGEEGLKASPEYTRVAGATLATGSPEDWESQLAALEAAQSHLEAQGAAKGPVQTMVKEVLAKQKQARIEAELKRRYGWLDDEVGKIEQAQKAMKKIIKKLDEGSYGDLVEGFNKVSIIAGKLGRKKTASDYIEGLDGLAKIANIPGEIIEAINSIKEAMGRIKSGTDQLANAIQSPDPNDEIPVEVLNDLYNRYSIYAAAS